jgi:hypothetical protein
MIAGSDVTGGGSGRQHGDASLAAQELFKLIRNYRALELKCVAVDCPRFDSTEYLVGNTIDLDGAGMLRVNAMAAVPKAQDVCGDRLCSKKAGPF